MPGPARVLGFILLATSLVPMLVMKSRATAPSPRQARPHRLPRCDAPYLLLNLGLSFGFMGLYVVFYYIQLLAMARTTVTSTLADYLLVIINGSSLAFVGFGVLVSKPIAGAILGKDQDLVGLIVWCGVLFVALRVSMAASRIVKVGAGLTRIT